MANTTLRDSINDALKNAMRAKEKERVAVLRLVMSEFKRIEVDERIEVEDARALAVLDRVADSPAWAMTPAEQAEKRVERGPLDRQRLRRCGSSASRSRPTSPIRARST